MKSYSFLFWGYLAVWVGLVAYLAALGRRLTAASKRLDVLEERRRSQ